VIGTEFFIAEPWPGDSVLVCDRGKCSRCGAEPVTVAAFPESLEGDARITKVWPRRARRLSLCGFCLAVLLANVEPDRLPQSRRLLENDARERGK